MAQVEQELAAEFQNDLNIAGSACGSGCEPKLDINHMESSVMWREEMTHGTWEDITSVLEKASHQLDETGMLTSHGFNLFESMSAIEIMDQKMDAGVLYNNKPILPLSHRLKHDLIPMKFSSSVDMLALLDRILVLEASLYNGKTCPHTLLTCVYLHKEVYLKLLSQLSQTIEQATTKEDTLLLIFCAFTSTLLRTGYLIRKNVLEADIFEEEDFVPSGTGIELGSQLTDEYVNNLLQAAEKRLKAIEERNEDITVCKKKRNRKNSLDGQSAAEVESLHKRPDVEKSLCLAFLNRIQFRKAFFAAILQLEKETPSFFDAAKKGVVAARSALQTILTEHVDMDEQCFSGTAIGCENEIVRLLAGAAPPQDVLLLPKVKAIEFFIVLLDELDTVCDPLMDIDSIQHLRHFLSSFSRSNPHIISRSYMLITLHMEGRFGENYNFANWLSCSMLSQGVPALLLSTQEGVQYISRALKPVYDIAKLYLFNRWRQRKRIEMMLNDWSLLQVEGMEIDEKFVQEMEIPRSDFPRYFTSWAIDKTLLLMIDYVHLGFEMELYSDFEVNYAFWYLDFIIANRLQNLNLSSAFMKQLRQQLGDEAAKTNSKSKGKSSGKKRGKQKLSGSSEAKDYSKQEFNYNFLEEIELLEAYRSLVRGLLQYSSTLILKGYVKSPDRPYGSMEMRFKHRFAVFDNLSLPRKLTYIEYLRGSDFSQYKSETILASATECFKMTREYVEKIVRTVSQNRLLVDELKSLAKVAISNSVQIARLIHEWKSDDVSTGLSTSTKQATFDYTISKRFPVISVDTKHETKS